MGHPVLGDVTYGYKYRRVKTNGQLLHAYKLSFIHPITNTLMEFKAPLPKDFDNMLIKIAQSI